uniref:IPO4/5-like TPR repeats domain-containing protein n=1 Tax=Strigamia maritima TaxID=126957 RepID=T1IJ37_STRMM
ATQELREAYKNPEVYLLLCNIICRSGNAQVNFNIFNAFYCNISFDLSQIRQYAAILLRRKVLKKKPWLKLPENLRQRYERGPSMVLRIKVIKQMILQRLVSDDDKLVRTSIAALAGTVTKHELPNGTWPEIMQFVHEYVKSLDPSARELAMFTMNALASSASVQLKKHFIFLFNLFALTLQEPENKMVIVYTIRFKFLRRTMTQLAYLISDEEKVVVQNLIPRCTIVMREFLMGNEAFACEMLDFFNELVESEVSVILPHVKQIVELCLEVAASPHLQEHTQLKAIDFISWLSRLKKRAILKHKLVVPILTTLFSIMCRPVDELDTIAEDNADEMADLLSAEDNTPGTYAAQVIDVMALHFPPEKLMPPLLELVEPALQSDNPYVKKAAYVAIAVTSEGCAEYIRSKYLHVLLQSVCKGMTDSNPVVRNAALFMLGQFSEYLQPDVSKYASELLPLLFEYLVQICQYLQKNEKQPPGGVVRMFYAIEMFCENMGKIKTSLRFGTNSKVDILIFSRQGILPYLPTLMERLTLILTVAKSVSIRELAISVIGAAASAAKEELLPYFQQIINHLKIFLTVDQPPENFPLQVQAIDALAVLARTIGIKNFLPLCEECLQLGLNLIVVATDPDLKRSIYGLFAALSFVLKEDLSGYLSKIIPHMINSLNSSEGVETRYKGGNALRSFELEDELQEDEDEVVSQGDDDEDEGDDDDDDDVSGYTVENAYQNEKEDACEAMREISQYTKEGFMPFLKQCIREVTGFLDYPAGSIRKVSIETLGQFCCSLHEVSVRKNSFEGIEALQNYLDVLLPRFVEIILEDLERETVIGALETITDMTKILKSTLFESGHFDIVLKATFDVMNGKTACQDIDDLDDEGGEFEAEYDAMLIEFAGDLISSLALAIAPEKYNPIFEKFFTIMSSKLKKNKTISERSFAIGVLAQSCENMSDGVLPFVPRLLPIFLTTVRDEHEEVRANAIFGLGVLAEHGKASLYEYPYKKQYPTILQVLSAALARETCRKPTDNICGAVARLIMANVNGIPMEQVFPVMIKCLPLKEDFEENKTIFRCFFFLLNMHHPQITKHFPEIFRVSSHILINKQ